MIPKNWRYSRGDIYYANMEPHVGSEQGGERPVVVLQNDTGNKHSPTLIIAHYLHSAKDATIKSNESHALGSHPF